MFLSVFDLFKPGIGPSSSHTMGPMTAAGRFLDLLRTRADLDPGAIERARLQCRLHGSLAWTGKGHATDRAVMLGLCGLTPETADPDRVGSIAHDIETRHQVRPEGLPPLAFDPETDLVFDFGPPLPGHPNGLVFSLVTDDGSEIAGETYYSVGGGFVLTADELVARDAGDDTEEALADVPYPFTSGAEMLAMGEQSGLSIAAMKRANETTLMDEADFDARLNALWNVMNGSINRGLSQEGTLPGGLNVRRRAADIHRQLSEGKRANRHNPHEVNDWIAAYAMAVNEENAAGGRIVTAPTNGAAGVLPATLRYYRDHCIDASDDGLHTALLTAAAIGGLIKHRASISGAEMGCQGEVGSASAMAAAGLCAALGGTNAQIENAAEIALEHHLGMTCDPAKGLVQVPCIERNGLGAIKAVSAASLALRGDGQHCMPLDNCIETMRQTGLDMNEKYKETSRGGIAVNIPEC